MTVIITEVGDILVQETVQGITGASNLNDVSLEAIFIETFATNPIARNWVIGANWSWSAVNLNMQ